MVGEALAHVQGFGLKAIGRLNLLTPRLLGQPYLFVPTSRVHGSASAILRWAQDLVRDLSYLMDEYNLFEDVLDTYQSMEPMMQFAWLVVPLVFVLALIMVFLHHLRHRPREDRPTAPARHPAMLYEDWHEPFPNEPVLIERGKERLRE